MANLICKPCGTHFPAISDFCPKCGAWNMQSGYYQQQAAQHRLQPTRDSAGVLPAKVTLSTVEADETSRDRESEEFMPLEDLLAKYRI